jgi:1-phosphofructokinase family hexose kinase
VILSIALGASVDTTYVVDDFHEGSQSRPVSVHRVAGGKALNLARAATTIGADATVLTVLGGTTGQFVETGLARAGVRLLRVAGSEETRSCVSVFSLASGLLTEIYEKPTPLTSDEWQGLLRAFRGVLAERPAWVSVSGGVPASLPSDALSTLVRAAHEAGARVAIDSHGPALSGVLRDRPDLVKVNRAEAAELLDADPSHPVLEFARGIRERSTGIVVVTDGKDGSVGVGDAGAIRATIDGIDGGFPVGSGDSYLGGLLTALERRETLEEAMRLATACGVANALQPGAAVFGVESVERVLPRVITTMLD